MSPEQQLRLLLTITNPVLASHISNAYTGLVNPLPYTNAIITGLGQLGIPVTQQGIINAHMLATKAMGPQRRFADVNRDGVVGGLADFASVLRLGAQGGIFL